MNHWLMRRAPHYSEITPNFIGKPYDYDKVNVNPRLKPGDNLYLIAANGELYGWGVVTKITPYHDADLKKEALNVTTVRPILRPNLIPVERIQKLPALARLFVDSNKVVVELQSFQVNLLNRLIRAQGEESPTDIEETENPNRHLGRLQRLYEHVSGSRTKFIELMQALDGEFSSQEEAWNEADYMKGEDWVDIVGDEGPPLLRLTHKGIKAVEEYLAHSQPFSSPQKEAVSNAEKVVSYNFPKIELSPAEQQWLGTACKQFLNGFLIDVGRLKKSWQSQGKWPKGFKPSEIDYRLLQNENRPTLLGVWHAYPINKWIPKCDQLIRYIKDRILASTSADIKVSDIATAIELPERSVSILIQLLPSLGLDYKATVAPIDHDKVRIPEEIEMYASLQIDDPEHMDDYLSYEGMEKQVKTVFGEDDLTTSKQQNMSNNNLILDRYELIRPLVGFKENIEKQIARFPFDKNVFLMMKFRDSNKELGDFIIDNLKSHDLIGVRADASGWNITKNVYNPIAVLYCCKYGIALFDEPEPEQMYSPNVAYELGIMHYQQKDCLILRHSKLPAVPFDLIKDLHTQYEKDLQVKKIISDWVAEITRE